MNFHGVNSANHVSHRDCLSTGESLIFLVAIQVWQTTIKHGSKAVGIDNVSKKEYAENLNENIKGLVIRLKNKAYKPAPSLRVYIPKGNGKMRPLGISIYEDKIVQLALKKILEAIYETKISR